MTYLGMNIYFGKRMINKSLIKLMTPAKLFDADPAAAKALAKQRAIAGHNAAMALLSKDVK